MHKLHWHTHQVALATTYPCFSCHSTGLTTAIVLQTVNRLPASHLPRLCVAQEIGRSLQQLEFFAIRPVGAAPSRIDCGRATGHIAVPVRANAVAITASVIGICFFCCREKRQQKRLVKAAEAAAKKAAAAKTAATNKETVAVKKDKNADKKVKKGR